MDDPAPAHPKGAGGQGRRMGRAAAMSTGHPSLRKEPGGSRSGWKKAAAMSTGHPSSRKEPGGRGGGWGESGGDVDGAPLIPEGAGGQPKRMARAATMPKVSDCSRNISTAAGPDGESGVNAEGFGAFLGQ